MKNVTNIYLNAKLIDILHQMTYDLIYRRNLVDIQKSEIIAVTMHSRELINKK